MLVNIGDQELSVFLYCSRTDEHRPHMQQALVYGYKLWAEANLERQMAYYKYS